MSNLTEGGNAPAFTDIPSSLGKPVSLSDFRGKYVVLYFYPKDDTPGCTKEACGFRDSFETLTKAGAVVLGVSKDSVRSHDKFIKKFNLPFILLSDEKHGLADLYYVWGEKKFMGRIFMGMRRFTFLISPDQKIVKIWTQVKPEIHAAEVLSAIHDHAGNNARKPASAH